MAEAARVAAEDPVPVAQHLHVGPARRRARAPDEHLALGLGDLLDAQVVGAVEDRGAHPAGSTTTALTASPRARELERRAGVARAAGGA